jgi:hypothetical protein
MKVEIGEYTSGAVGAGLNPVMVKGSDKIVSENNKIQLCEVKAYHKSAFDGDRHGRTERLALNALWRRGTGWLPTSVSGRLTGSAKGKGYRVLIRRLWTEGRW